MQTKDYYKLLDIPSDADGRQIKEAYRRKAFEFHPDRNKDNSQAPAMMQAINEAYAVLADPQKRRDYDDLKRSYGDAAHQQFRQSYSEHDIFTNSDFRQIFEEMARGFGLRGFEDIFKDIERPGFQSFEVKRPGMHSKGFIFRRGLGQRNVPEGGGMAMRLLGKAANKWLGKMTGIQLPQKGADVYHSILVSRELADKGGPYEYYLRLREKKLVIQIPAQIQNGRQIRLAGMGREGAGGAENGDLYLRVKIKDTISRKIRSLLGLNG
jgi:DnaJ-class molecular chaperone